MDQMYIQMSRRQCLGSFDRFVCQLKTALSMVCLSIGGQAVATKEQGAASQPPSLFGVKTGRFGDDNSDVLPLVGSR